MEGLVILNSHTEMGLLATLMLSVGICFVLCAVLSVVGLFDTGIKKQLIRAAVSAVLGLALIITSTLLPVETIVKAYIDGNVRMEELTEVYDVREVDGLLLTLVEKEVNS